jgi:hypothetical protein
MATPESLLQEEQAAEEALRQAYTQAEGTPEHSESAEPIETEAEPASAVPESGGEWEHKYQVLRGKYDAELPRALDEARYWRDRCDQLQAQLTALAQQPAMGGAEPEIDQALHDYLGEGAAMAVAKLLDQQKRDLEEKFGQVAHLTRQSAEQSFWAQVRQAFPNYADMQNDPALNQWLAAAWPGSRQTRLQQAQALAQALDADGFIGLLRAYAPAAAPGKPAMPGPTPRRAAGSGTPPPAKPAYSPADLEGFGSRIMKLKGQGRWQEAANLEKEFDAVVREKRIGV